MSWIDIGVNLTSKRFEHDREQVIERAKANGVEKLIITGTNALESEQAFELSQTNPNLYSTAGCHPHDAQHMTDNDWQSIQNLLQQDSVKAVGECGLDFNRNFSSPKSQISVFEQHLQLACEIQKPLFLHERDANEEMLRLLSKYQHQLPASVIHCFTGSEQALQAYIELDLYIGITGWICDERRGLELAQMVHLIPDNRLLLETDAPYLTPRDLPTKKQAKPKKGRNEPSLLPHIGEKVAQCRQQSLGHIEKLSFDNAVQCFNLNP